MAMERKASKCEKGNLNNKELFNDLKREKQVSNGNEDRLFSNY